jgi:hypothetical protein
MLLGHSRYSRSGACQTANGYCDEPTAEQLVPKPNLKLGFSATPPPPSAPACSPFGAIV